MATTSTLTLLSLNIPNTCAGQRVIGCPSYRKAWQLASLAGTAQASHDQPCMQYLLSRAFHQMQFAVKINRAGRARQYSDGEDRTLARKPNWPSMRVDTISMSVTLDFSTMDVMSAFDMSRSRTISVPSAILRSAAARSGSDKGRERDISR